MSELFVTNSPRLEDRAAEITDEQLLIAVQTLSSVNEDSVFVQHALTGSIWWNIEC